MITFVIAVELAGKRTRTIVGINVETPFAIGEAVVSVVGIRVKDWKHFQVVAFFSNDASRESVVWME